MSQVTAQQSISLDGFIAGPNQSLENPIGENGLRLHQSPTASTRLSIVRAPPRGRGRWPSPVVTHIRYRVDASAE
jgi:hypothetical protein